MSKLIGMYRFCDNLLKIWSVNGKRERFRGVLYEFKFDTSVSPNTYKLNKVSSANFYADEGKMSVQSVKSYIDMTYARKTSSEDYVDPNHRVIWTNGDYEEWEYYIIKHGDDEYETTFSDYNLARNDDMCDERVNLNVEVNGCIVAFADLGLWDGRHYGGKVIGTNVKDILYSDCDTLDWYCDRYDVRCTASHHDGTNYILYRVVKDKEAANELVDAIARGEVDEKTFRKKTKSLRSYVARVYGW